MNKNLAENTLQIWQIKISDWQSQVESLQATLSQQESDRAYRYVTQALTDSFICTRGVLRRLLSCYLEQSADTIEFAEGAHGKPCLVCEANKPALYFNVSHAGDYAVYAFCRDYECGIDIENMQRISDQLAIAERFFTKGECEELQTLQDDKQTERFFYFWTRKEALLKATGKGLSQPLDSIDVRQHKLKDNNQIWQLHTLDIKKPYCLSIAVRPEVNIIELQQYY